MGLLEERLVDDISEQSHRIFDTVSGRVFGEVLVESGDGGEEDDGVGAFKVRDPGLSLQMTGSEG